MNTNPCVFTQPGADAESCSKEDLELIQALPCPCSPLQPVSVSGGGRWSSPWPCLQSSVRPLEVMGAVETGQGAASSCKATAVRSVFWVKLSLYGDERGVEGAAGVMPNVEVIQCYDVWCCSDSLRAF